MRCLSPIHISKWGAYRFAAIYLPHPLSHRKRGTASFCCWTFPFGLEFSLWLWWFLVSLWTLELTGCWFLKEESLLIECTKEKIESLFSFGSFCVGRARAGTQITQNKRVGVEYMSGLHFLCLLTFGTKEKVRTCLCCTAIETELSRLHFSVHFMTNFNGKFVNHLFEYSK